MTKVERIIARINSIEDRVILDGALSDFANHLGVLLAEELPSFKDWPNANPSWPNWKGDKFGDDYDSLTSGFKHGVSLIDGTHDGIPADNRTLFQKLKGLLCLKN